MNADKKSRTTELAEKDRSALAVYSSRPRAKRRVCFSQRKAYRRMHTVLALLLLFAANSSGFVVSVARDYPSAVFPETNMRKKSSPRFLCAASTKTKTEPITTSDAWSERLHQKESEHVFIMEVGSDNVNSNAPSLDEDNAGDESEESRGEMDVDDDDEVMSEKRRKARARAALLAKRGGGRKSPSSRTPKQTSVGARRVGSATLNRRGGSASSQIMDGLRKTAQGTSSSPTSAPKKNTCDKKKDPPTTSARISQAVVQSAIEDLLNRPDKDKLTAAFSAFGRNMGILKEPLVKEGIEIRQATPNDDFDIASLRLSVFSDFSPDLQNQFCVRSCQAIAARRRRGAICFVATAQCRNSMEGSRSDVILGSAECSFHEFVGTRLGRRRLPNSILYVTEVAVSPSARRRRIGSKLMDSIFSLAQKRCAETLYLHCDVQNYGALRLYENAGYRKLLSDDPMYREFTKSLNLHPGATKGREHFLLYKNVVSEPTWLEDTAVQNNVHDSRGRKNELIGVLGFEIPA